MRNQLIALLNIHAAMSLLLGVVVYFACSKVASLGFLFGAGVSFFNLLTLVIVWPLILRKKLVALSGGIIVIKFAILGWILYEVVTQNSLQVGWFATGLAVVVLSVLVTAFIVSNPRFAIKYFGHQRSLEGN